MTMPIFSLKRGKKSLVNGERIYLDTIKKYKWHRGSTEVGLTVVGTAKSGCPDMYDADVLFGLFKIVLQSVDGVIEIKDNKVVNIPRKINFTYRKLAKVMGYKGFGKSTKTRLENSILCMNETTIYSDLALRDHVSGEYVVDYKGNSSFRLLENYKEYSISKRKRTNKDLLSGKQVEEYQSVEIGEFFYNNLCNNYFKLLDYNLYLKLSSSVAKKLMLILIQWSHGSEKKIKIETLIEYMGIDIDTKEKQYKFNKDIKKALEELVSVNFIKSYVLKTNDYILFIFASSMLIKKKLMSKYISDNEIVGGLMKYQVDYGDISKFCREDNKNYVAALLRYIDYKVERGASFSPREYLLKGLTYENYDVSEFMLN